ncbi:MAG TPA: hypothetical protein DDW91_02965, partial [Shewanella frigidimarina]|nr:hypothetical protein [Shewanella frigidimarina]
GKPCKRGHLTERSVSSGKCKLCNHATRRGEAAVNKPKGYWLIMENVVAESKKYKTKSEMKAANQPAFLGMSKLKISNELFPDGFKSNGYWTVERCIKTASSYET